MKALGKSQRDAGPTQGADPCLDGFQVAEEAQAARAPCPET